MIPEGCRGASPGQIGSNNTGGVPRGIPRFKRGLNGIGCASASVLLPASQIFTRKPPSSFQSALRAHLRVASARPPSQGAPFLRGRGWGWGLGRCPMFDSTERDAELRTKPRNETGPRAGRPVRRAVRPCGRCRGVGGCHIPRDECFGEERQEPEPGEDDHVGDEVRLLGQLGDLLEPGRQRDQRLLRIRRSKVLTCGREAGGAGDGGDRVGRTGLTPCPTGGCVLCTVRPSEARLSRGGGDAVQKKVQAAASGGVARFRAHGSAGRAPNLRSGRSAPDIRCRRR
eukprot:scaffold24375_cov78-Isochrysis_galbana.AAC.2